MDIRTILKEELQKVIDEAYPTAFDLRAFSQIPSYRERVNYCDRLLTKLAAGSSRIAYQVDDEKVLKIAKNAKGIAQNENEAMWSHQQYDIVARTFATDRNDLWLEMELASKLTPNRFKQLTGVDIKDMADLQYAIIRNYGSEIQKYFDKYEDTNEFFMDWYHFINDNGYERISDYSRLSSFGEVVRNGQPQAVLIDIGINDDILTSFYRRH